MDSVYLITGGASGLGRALAISLANKSEFSNRNKLKICIADVHEQRGLETVTQLQQQNVDAFYQHCDITCAEDVEKLKQAMLDKWSRVDVVINNAGVATGGDLQSETIEQWQWVLNINLLGMVRVSQCFLEVFKLQNRGYFINISSQAGLTPIPLMSSYNAVKSAVVGLSETMKLELGQYNVDVSVVCPSFFRTNLDENTRSNDAHAGKLMNKLFEKANLSSMDVANQILKQSLKRPFLILTHDEGRKTYLLKKLLPNAWYLKLMAKQTRRMLKKPNTESKLQPSQNSAEVKGVAK